MCGERKFCSRCRQELGRFERFCSNRGKDYVPPIDFSPISQKFCAQSALPSAGIVYPIQGWRIVAMFVIGIFIWVLVGAFVRVGLLAVDFWGLEGTFIGTITRELLACYLGAIAAVALFKNKLNKRSSYLCGFLFGIALGSLIFGGILFFSVVPGIPFAINEAIWYASAGVGSIGGIWQGLHEA